MVSTEHRKGNSDQPLAPPLGLIVPPFGPGDVVLVRRPWFDRGEDTHESGIVLCVDRDGPGSVDLQFDDGCSMGLRSHHVLAVLPPPAMRSRLFWEWLTIAILAVDREIADRLIAELHAAVRSQVEGSSLNREDGIPW